MKRGHKVFFFLGMNCIDFLKQITSIEIVLKLWRMRNLKLNGKITVFKALTMSKIVQLALITNILISSMKELKYKSNSFGKTKIQK